MARFQLTEAIVIPGAIRYRAGTIIADSVANALPGDKVWTGLSAATLFDGMVPLDASATTMKTASPFAGTLTRPYISGVDSIDA